MKASFPLLVFLAVGGLSGCATKDYVHEYVDGQIAPVNSQVRSLDGRVSGAEAGLKEASGRVGGLAGRVEGLDVSLKEQGGRIEANSRTAREALERANAAGKLAAGKFLYEVVMSGPSVAFELENGHLSQAAKIALDDFATDLKRQNRNVYIEIQGHTDTTGSEAYNLRLAQARAESVRRYLNMQAGVPLHRMSVISYGESAPVADNSTREGRQQNRRVALIVLE